MRFIPNSPSVREAMLAEIGASRIEDLFASIPDAVRLKRALELPDGLAEADQLEMFARLAAQNEGANVTHFLGAGAYPHFSPLVTDSLIQRAEFFTAYTPYQPEVAQGTLQAIFEFQSFICILTGMDVANASVYDGASATAEAVLMAERLQKNRTRVLLPEALHPQYRDVLRTYAGNLGLTLDTVPIDPESGRMDPDSLEAALGDDVICVLAQQPNFLGVVEDLAPLAERAHGAGALFVTTVSEALSLALLAPPGEAGADIVCGEAQSFGVPLAYGGPYLGFMACRDQHKRQMPGRIAGETEDAEGRRGYVLTLATREQHIRRERATSNICTNQNLVMLSAVIHLTLTGRHGLQEAAGQNVSLLAYLLERISELKGYEKRFTGPSFNEVALRCPRPAAEVIAACRRRDILPGLDLAPLRDDLADTLLLAVTETKRKADLDALVAALEEAAR